MKQHANMTKKGFTKKITAEGSKVTADFFITLMGSTRLFDRLNKPIIFLSIQKVYALVSLFNKGLN